MKKAFVCVVLIGMSSVFAVDTAVDVGVYSHYVWRGITFDTHPVIQGSVTVTSENGLYFTTWANYSTSAEKIGEGGLNELDYTLGYAGTWDVVDYEIGYSYFTYPTTGWVAYQELFAGAALNNLPVVPSLYAYYDMEGVGGFYLLGDLNYGHSITDEWSADVGVSCGWGDSTYHNAWIS